MILDKKFIKIEKIKNKNKNFEKRKFYLKTKKSQIFKFSQLLKFQKSGKNQKIENFRNFCGKK